MIRKNQSAFLKGIRKAAGLTQKEVAELAGISIAQYAQFEGGKAFVPDDKVWSLAKGFFKEKKDKGVYLRLSVDLVQEMGKDWKQKFIDKIQGEYDLAE